MIATFLFTFSLAVAQQIAQPSPAPTLPPEIIHTVSSETCNALPSLLLPMGRVSELNDQGFGAMSVAVDGYMSHFTPEDDPHIEHPSLEVAQVPAGHSKGNQGAAAEGLLTSQADDPVAYGPDQTIKMSRINTIAGQLATNIGHERQVLAQSYKEQPRGKNSTLDALRQKMEDVIETQDLLVQRYQNLASLYLENLGEAGVECNTQACLIAFKANLRELIIDSSVGLGTATVSASSSATDGYKDYKELSKTGTAAEIVGAMRLNETQFSKAMYALYNDCHGTNLVVPEATRAPDTLP